MIKYTFGVTALTAIGLFVLSACTAPSPPDYAAQYRPIQDAFVAVWNDGNLDGLDAIAAPSYQRHGDLGTTAGNLAVLKKVIKGFRTAYPDMHVTIEEAHFTQDRGLSLWTFTGTNTGASNIPATGKSVKVSGMSLIRYASGKIADETVYFDSLDMSQQLGYTVVPPAGAAKAH